MRHGSGERPHDSTRLHTFVRDRPGRLRAGAGPRPRCRRGPRAAEHAALHRRRPRPGCRGPRLPRWQGARPDAESGSLRRAGTALHERSRQLGHLCAEPGLPGHRTLWLQQRRLRFHQDGAGRPNGHGDPACGRLPDRDTGQSEPLHAEGLVHVGLCQGLRGTRLRPQPHEVPRLLHRVLCPVQEGEEALLLHGELPRPASPLSCSWQAAERCGAALATVQAGREPCTRVPAEPAAG